MRTQVVLFASLACIALAHAGKIPVTVSHVETFSAPAPIYEVPIETYAAPVETYGPPAVYEAPVETYGPPPVYEEPKPVYGVVKPVPVVYAPKHGYGKKVLKKLAKPLIVAKLLKLPVLALKSLALKKLAKPALLL